MKNILSILLLSLCAVLPAVAQKINLPTQTRGVLPVANGGSSGLDPRSSRFGSCNGLTDTSAAATACWQAAVNYMEANGGEVQCGAGTFWSLNRVLLNGSGDIIRGAGGTTRGCQIQPTVDAAFVPRNPSVFLNEVHMSGIYFTNGSNAVDLPLINGFYGDDLWFQNQTGCSLTLVSGERWIIGMNSVHSGASGFSPLCTGDPSKSLFASSVTAYCTAGAFCGMATAEVYWLQELGSLNGAGFSAQWLWWGGNDAATGGILTGSRVYGLKCFFSCGNGLIQLKNVYNSTIYGPDTDNVGTVGAPEAVGVNITGSFQNSHIIHYTPCYNVNHMTVQMHIDLPNIGSSIEDSYFCNLALGGVDNSTKFGLQIGNAFQSSNITLNGVFGGVFAQNPTGSYKATVIGSILSPSNLLGGAALVDQTNSPISFHMMADDNGSAADTANFRVHRAIGGFAYADDFDSNGTTFTFHELVNMPSLTASLPVCTDGSKNLTTSGCPVATAGTTYYVSNTGSDAANGTSPATPWQTIAKVNGFSFNACDTVLFQSGGTWREQLTVPRSGQAGCALTFGAYGSGSQPQILGSLSASTAGNWTNESGSIWYAAASPTPNIVWRDGVRLTLVGAKVSLANTGQFWWDSVNNRVYTFAAANPTIGPHVYEIAQRAYAITATDRSYVTVSGISASYVNTQLINVVAASSSSTNWTLNGCTLTGAWKGGAYFIGGDATHTVSNLSISGNTITDVGGSPANFWDGSNILVSWADAVSIHDNTLTLTGFTGQHNYVAGVIWQHSATSGDSSSSVYQNDVSGTNTVATSATGLSFSDIHYAKIYSNYVHGNFMRGMWTDESGSGTDDGSFFTSYYYNLIVMSGVVGDGFILEVSSNDIVSYNVVDTRAGNVNDPWAFLMGVGRAADGYATNTQVYGNTFLTAAGGITVQLSLAAYNPRKLKNVTLKNNLLYFDGTAGALMQTANQGSGDDGDVFGTNLYYNGGSVAYFIKWFGTTYSTLAAFQSAHGTQDIGSVSGNPTMASVATHNYRLLSGSPAIDVGANLGTAYQNGISPFSDFPFARFNQNNAGTGWDIGAFVYVAH